MEKIKLGIVGYRNLGREVESAIKQNQKQILSISYYLVMEERNLLIRFPKWVSAHVHPYAKKSC